jgi:hypothetical protein
MLKSLNIMQHGGATPVQVIGGAEGLSFVIDSLMHLDASWLWVCTSSSSMYLEAGSDIAQLRLRGMGEIWKI